MIPVEVSDTADADRAGILEYGWDLFGEAAATAYLRGFDDAFALIAERRMPSQHRDLAYPIG